MSPKAIRAAPEKVAAYERLLRTVPEIDEKSNFGSAYTAINGNMYSLISKHGVVGIRLAAPDHREFMQRYGAEVFRGDPAWPPSKEYVAVPDAMLGDTAALTPWLERSLAYAKTLRPRPTKR
jgi:hypothetical protein